MERLSLGSTEPWKGRVLGAAEAVLDELREEREPGQRGGQSARAGDWQSLRKYTHTLTFTWTHTLILTHTHKHTHTHTHTHSPTHSHMRAAIIRDLCLREPRRRVIGHVHSQLRYLKVGTDPVTVSRHNCDTLSFVLHWTQSSHQPQELPQPGSTPDTGAGSWWTAKRC